MNNLLKTLVVGVFIIGIGLSKAQAQLATYTVTTSNDANNKTNPNDVAATQSLTDSVLAPATNLVMGPDLNPGYPFGYSISSNEEFYQTSLSGANTKGSYITFTITPRAGTTLDLTDIDFTNADFVSDFAGSGQSGIIPDGDTASGYTASLTSNVDGYTSDLGNDIKFNFSTAGTDITLGSEFSDLTTATTFRLEFYGTAGPDEPGYAYLYLTDGSSIDVNGSSELSIVAPEPSSYVLMGVGLGMCALVLRNRRTSAV